MKKLKEAQEVIFKAVGENTWLANHLTELAGGLRKARRVFQRVYQCVSEVQKDRERAIPSDRCHGGDSNRGRSPKS